MPELSPLDGSLFGPDQPCFGCGPRHPAGFHLAFAIDGPDAVVTRFVPGPLHQGPLGVMHGGLVTTLADEVAAWAILAHTGKFGFTTSLTAKFERPVRIGVETIGRGTLTRRTSRIAHVAVEIRQSELCFSSELKFVILDRAGAERLMGQPMPEEWSRFAR